MFKESFHMAIQNIMHNKMRSFLTVLGIIIGVAAIISLITIVNGFQTEMMDQFSSLGANTVSVTASGTSLKRGITDSELEQIAQIDGVTGVAPTVTADVTVVADGEKADKVTVEGRSSTYFDHETDMIQLGRALSAADISNMTNVAVVNEDFVSEYLQNQNPIGQTIIVGGVEYEIVGVSGESSSAFAAMAGSSDTVIIPYKNALRLTGTSSIVSFSSSSEAV